QLQGTQPESNPSLHKRVQSSASLFSSEAGKIEHVSLPHQQRSKSISGRIEKLEQPLEQSHGATASSRCPNCDGEKRVVCPRCKGKGTTKSRIYLVCYGLKTIPCSRCNGREDII